MEEKEESMKIEPGEVEASVSLPTPPSPEKYKGENGQAQNGVVQQGSVIPVSDEKIPSKPADKAADLAIDKTSGGSLDRDSALARVETEKRHALIKAWEENEKAKADNKAHKKISEIGAWENTKKASVETELKKIEEKLEKQKAEYREQMKNKVAEIRKAADEKRAMVEAKRGEEFLKVEETAAKYRTSGYTPRNFLGCFGS